MQWPLAVEKVKDGMAHLLSYESLLAGDVLERL
jgi:hypothetical protein